MTVKRCSSTPNVLSLARTISSASRVRAWIARRAGTRTNVGHPPGFPNSQDIVQKETGAVLQVDALALQKGLHGGVCPKGMDIGGEGFEKGSWVGGMRTGAASRELWGEGKGTRLDGLNESVIISIVLRGIGRMEEGA